MSQIVILVIAILVTIMAMGLVIQVIQVIIQGPDAWVNPFAEDGTLYLLIEEMITIPSKIICAITKVFYMMANGIIGGVLGIAGVEWDVVPYECD